MRAAIIADDLTGALDTGVQFVRAGHRVRVILPALGAGGPEFHIHPKGADVLVVDTETRNASSADAAAVVTDAALLLHAAGARHFFKKIDSTLRGPWVEELEALRRALSLQRVLVCPAFPALGRTVREGHVYLDGEAIPGAGVREQLGTRLRAVSSGGVFLTYDAATNAELLELARQAVQSREEILLCGSAGLAAAWAPLLPGAAPQPPEPVPACSRVLVVAGSRTPQVRSQLEDLRRSGLLASAGAPSVLQLTAPEGLAAAAEDPKVAQRLADTAAQLLTDTPCDGLILTGGETAIRVLRALGVRGLHLVAEALPGLPLSIAHGGAIDGARIITKAGSFGAHDALTRAARLMLAD